MYCHVRSDWLWQRIPIQFCGIQSGNETSILPSVVVIQLRVPASKMLFCDFNDVMSAIYDYNEDSLWLMPDKGGGWEGPKWQPASPMCLNWPEMEVRSVHFFPSAILMGLWPSPAPSFANKALFVDA